jgi:hypothetical protein
MYPHPHSNSIFLFRCSDILVEMSFLQNCHARENFSNQAVHGKSVHYMSPENRVFKRKHHHDDGHCTEKRRPQPCPDLQLPCEDSDTSRVVELYKSTPSLFPTGSGMSDRESQPDPTWSFSSRTVSRDVPETPTHNSSLGGQSFRSINLWG